MNYGKIVVGEAYRYIPQQGMCYSRYAGKLVRVARKSDKRIKLVTVEFVDGPRKGQTRILNASELEP